MGPKKAAVAPVASPPALEAVDDEPDPVEFVFLIPYAELKLPVNRKRKQSESQLTVDEVEKRVLMQLAIIRDDQLQFLIPPQDDNSHAIDLSNREEFQRWADRVTTELVSNPHSASKSEMSVDFGEQPQGA